MTVVSPCRRRAEEPVLDGVVGESAANGVQLVVETAETVMPGLCILVFNYGYEANTQSLLFGCWGLVEG